MKLYRKSVALTLLFGIQNTIAQADMRHEMMECRKIPVISDRVDCYDMLADRLNQMGQNEQHINEKMTEKPQSEIRERTIGQKFLETFGLKEPEGETIILEVEKIKFGPQKQFMVTTSNGQTWLQTGNQRVNLPTHLPFEVTIERGAMGSYFLYAKGQQTHYKVKRIK
ncbi:MAG: hypothetical protein K9G26_08035 [Emcibacter sp.]|nr:hypothetical protein [Emcibacter sp.]